MLAAAVGVGVVRFVSRLMVPFHQNINLLLCPKQTRPLLNQKSTRRVWIATQLLYAVLSLSILPFFFFPFFVFIFIRCVCEKRKVTSSCVCFDYIYLCRCNASSRAVFLLIFGGLFPLPFIFRFNFPLHFLTMPSKKPPPSSSLHLMCMP